MKTPAAGSFLSLRHLLSPGRRLLPVAVLLVSGVFLTVLPTTRAQDTGTLTVLHTFTGGDDGYYPNALIQGRDGNFYGTTSTFYDRSPGEPSGTVFRLTPAGVLTTLYRFAGGSDGNRPEAALVQGIDGNFYGTTAEGGDADAGTVFRITPQGEYTRLHSFTYAEGYAPRAALVQGLDGSFYGTTSQGGPYNRGIAFVITPAGALTVLHSFGALGEASDPVGSLIQGFDGNFYGTATGGYGGGIDGAVYRITPQGGYSVVHIFNTDSSYVPQGTLVQAPDGNFYGTAATVRSYGSESYYPGTVYRLSPAGDFTVLHQFTGNEAAFIQAGLVQGRDGNFYGTSAYGGPDYQFNGHGGNGNIFEVTPAGRVTVLYDFTHGHDGWLPNSNLTQGTDGNFYGASQFGGDNTYGTLFKLTVNPPPAFFDGAVALDNGVYYLAFPDGNYFGYYSFLPTDAHYIYHQDLGFEYVFDANDGQGGVYLYDFASGDFFYTSPSYPFPYLYDFALGSVLYYFPDPSRADHYNINGMRDFFLFSTRQVITR